MNYKQNNNLDELLDDLKSQHQTSKTAEPKNNNEINSLLDEVKSELKTNKQAAEKNTSKTSQTNSQDDLLDNFKSQYQAAKTTTSNDSTSIDNLLDRVKSEVKTDQTTKDNDNTATQNNTKADLLADFKSKHQAAKTSEVKKDNNQIDNLFDEVKSEIKTNRISTSANSDRASQSPTNEHLDSIKARYKNKQKQRQSHTQSDYNRNGQEIIRQEQQKQLQRKQSIRQAEKWLAHLDPLSDEGMWFDQLAESYPSRLEAAIAYLSTINQS